MSSSLPPIRSDEQIRKIGTLLDHENFTEAYPLFEVLLRVNPDNVSYLLAAGKCAMAIEKTDAALEHFRNAHELKPSARTAKHMAEILFKKGDFREALVLSYFAFVDDVASHLNAELYVLYAECLEALGYKNEAKQMLQAHSGVHYGLHLDQEWQDRRRACLFRVQNTAKNSGIDIQLDL